MAGHDVLATSIAALSLRLPRHISYLRWNRKSDTLLGETGSPAENGRLPKNRDEALAAVLCLDWYFLADILEARRHTRTTVSFAR